jgi:hypothetical protein
MVLAVAVCLVLLVAAIVTHYEALRMLAGVLPAVRIAPRAKLILVLITAFFSHALQILLYALGYVWFANLGLGTFKGLAELTLLDSLYFSAETFTSLGFGDIVPTGPLQLLASSETLIGLLLIGWSASYTFVAMERFWAEQPPARRG